MPNIEIHGLRKKPARRLREKIFQHLNLIPSFLKDSRSKPYADDTVVDIVLSDAQDKNGNSTPYIRLFTASNDPEQEIVDNLLELGLDLEHIELKNFYPRREAIIA